MLNLILWLIFGALIGWIASIIMGKNAQMGAVANIVVGIVGSFIGGWISQALGFGSTTGQFNLTGIIMGVIGAVILLAIVNLIRR